jgi:serine/threonine protein kinase
MQQSVQPKRSKYKKSTKKYVQDNILDIIDIEETLLKNRYISKVQTADFIYSKFIPKHDSLKPIIKTGMNNVERISPTLECKLFPKLKSPPQLILNPEKINYENLNKNKFNINFKKLKLEYKNGYNILFIKEYYPVDIIGAGTFGLVVNVIRIKTGQKMAVKIIDKNNANLDSDYLNKEVNILKILDNPRIMKIYDILDNSQYFFIFMELIEGGNLKDLIIKRYLDKNIYLFRDSECSQIMKGIFEALNYLHKNNIIHRDIKPENILFKNKDDLNSVILCDFGLAYQMKENEDTTTGLCGTTIYMAPEVILKKKYDYMIDSFSAGIVLYILCSGGMHPFYSRGISQKDYTEKLISTKCLCNFSTEMPLLARNLFLKLCKFEPIFRYPINKALSHPWITRSSKSQIPLTIYEEYNKNDKIKTFKQLLFSMICLSTIKKNLFRKKKKKKDISKNNSYYENLEKTFLKGNNLNINNNNLNKKDKYFLLTNIKKSLKQFFLDNNDEKKNQQINHNIINSHLLNIKSTKNIKKIKSPMLSPNPVFFPKNEINFKYNGNNIDENGDNYQPNLILQTQLFKENNENSKERKKQTKSKTQAKYNKIKSNSERIFLNKVKLFQKSSEKKEKDLNNNNKTIQINGRTKKKNNLLPGLNSANKSNKNYNNPKIFLNKHIVIESKNKNIRGDSRKNNNSAISGNNDDNKNNSQIKNKLKEIKNNNNKNNFQKIQNETKNPAKFYFLRNVFNNNDF